MPDEIPPVSYGHSGYETFEDEAEEHHEAREQFRRRFLCGIRGRLRENGGLRIWITFLMAWCGLFAWTVAWALHSTGLFRWLWLPGLGVLVAWPLYVLVLKWRAKREARRLDLAGHWDSLKTHDEYGDIHDHSIAENIDDSLRKAWDGNRYSGSNQCFGILLLAIVSLGTWIIWDLLRMGPALMAEIILDGEIVPQYPAIRDRMPSEPWYKTALLSTGLHFFSVAILVTIIEVIWKLSRLSH